MIYYILSEICKGDGWVPQGVRAVDENETQAADWQTGDGTPAIQHTCET